FKLRGEWVNVERLLDAPRIVRIPETIRPVRHAIIVAAFPYQAQVNEFRARLRLASDKDVLDEKSKETTSGAESVPLQAFRFLGVDAERRSLDRLGKPLDVQRGDNGWEPIDVAASFKPLVLLSNRRTEPEDTFRRKDKEVSFDRVVFPG